MRARSWTRIFGNLRGDLRWRHERAQRGESGNSVTLLRWPSFLGHRGGCRMDDRELLAEYVERKSPQALADLVERYIDLVYSAAARQAGDRHLAEDVTQGVFLVLAQKA